MELRGRMMQRRRMLGQEAMEADDLLWQILKGAAE